MLKNPSHLMYCASSTLGTDQGKTENARNFRLKQLDIFAPQFVNVVSAAL